jgi:hypothetical protein
MAAMTNRRAAYWNSMLENAKTNRDRARVLWDFARSLAGRDDAAWADLVRVLHAWIEHRAA